MENYSEWPGIVSSFTSKINWIWLWNNKKRMQTLPIPSSKSVQAMTSLPENRNYQSQFFFNKSGKIGKKTHSLEVAKVIDDRSQHPQIIRALLKTMWMNATKIDPNSVRSDEFSGFLYSIVLCWLFYASENSWRTR